MSHILLSLTPFLIFTVLLAIAAYCLAPRVGASRALWVIGSLIPVFNFIFLYYMGFKVVVRVLDQLNALHERLIGPA